jgi:hypothetical protein
MKYKLSPLGGLVPEEKPVVIKQGGGAVHTGAKSLNDLSDVNVSGGATDNQALAWDDATSKWIPQTISGGGGGTGDVVGPASATNNAVTRFDGTTGKLIQNSTVTISDTGNIATTGTVDGRDVSTDGSKLDGIEALADVTDTTNVTAAGALMDSELTSIADVKGLNQSVVSAATPNFGIANMTLDDTSLVVVPETNLQDFAEGVDHSLFKARGTGVNTTYVSTVAVGGTTFAQPEVRGEIKSDQGYFDVHYTGATGVTVANLTAISTFVYIDKDGALQQQTTTPTREDWSRKIFTMRIGVNTVTEQIIGFEYENNPLGNYSNSTRDLYSYLLAQGVPFKKDQLVTGRTDNLGFDVSAGSLMEFGGTGDINNPNIKTFDAAANTSYNLLSRTTIVSSETNLIKSWDNAGTITALGSTTLVGHRLYRFSNGNFAIQYGQGNYANMALAKAGVLLEDYVLNPALKDATFMGWWLIEDIATNTGNTGATITTAFVEYTIGVQGGSSSSLSGALLKGNNLSDLLDAGTARTNLGLDTTVNQTDSSNKRFVTDAEATVIGNTSGTNTGDNATNTQYSGLAASKANLASPTFTGTVTLPAAQAVNGVTLSTAQGTGNFLRGDGTYAAPAGGGGGDLLAANNLSDVSSATTSRTNLGLEIGTDVQAYSAVLDGTTASFTTADETKLDGVETGADVTDATNVTAAGALMDSELTSIADVKALDQSVVSGAAPVFDATNMTNIPAGTVDVLSNVATARLVGRTTAGSGNSEELTKTSSLSFLNVEDGADVTDTANVTTAGALMDSEVTNLAQVKAFDSADYAAALGADDNYVTDAEKVVIGNTSSTNSGNDATNSQYSGLAASKQDTLVSATNIKTINSTSLLGSGNITTPNTTYSEISEAEITTGTASTSRAISGRRAEFIALKGAAKVTTTTLGLNNVDNTSDATKDAATATLTNKDLSSSTNTFPDFYPVGTLYENRTNSANPSTYLPGQSSSTWTAITDKMIMARGATYTADGGAATHTHNLTGARANVSPLGIGSSSNVYYELDTGTTFTSTHRTLTNATAQTSVQTTSGSSRLQGNTDSGSSIPPMIVAYVWERTA